MSCAFAEVKNQYFYRVECSDHSETLTIDSSLGHTKSVDYEDNLITLRRIGLIFSDFC